MTKTLTAITVLALIGYGLGQWLGSHIGWGTFSFGLLFMLLVSGAQLEKIRRWLQRDIHSPPPASIGPWDEVLAPVYRELKTLRQQKSHLHADLHATTLAAEALPDGVLTLNELLEVQWCNAAAAQHLGLNIATDRHHAITNILRAPEFLTYAQQPEAWEAPLLLHSSQPSRPQALLVQLIAYGQAQTLMVTRDMSQMERLETTRKDFVANVSHELRTPLTVLIGFLETLSDPAAAHLAPKQRRHYEQLMREQAHHMQAIVEDLLTLSSLESSRSNDGLIVHATKVIRAVLQQAQLLSNEQHIWQIELEEDVNLIGTEQELASAFANLLTNAVRYTPAGGTIQVRWARSPNGGAQFAVQDTGIGIAPQDVPRLTERFYRADKGRARATGGTGLGLAITRHVVLRHQAELMIQSRLGEGSCFHINFPAQVVRPQPTSANRPSTETI